MILKALGHEPPVYAHLPLLHGPDGKKLSKRHGAASVQELRDAGYLPEAIRNYLALLGWGYDDKQTIFTTEELQKLFTLDRVSKSAAVFDEQKLRWMNGIYLREMPLEELTARLEAFTGRDRPRRRRRALPGEDPDARRFLADGRLLLRRSDRRPEGAREVPRRRGQHSSRRTRARRSPTPSRSTRRASRRASAISSNASNSSRNKVFQPIRVAISGTTISPGIFESLELLGKEESLKRIDRRRRCLIQLVPSLVSLDKGPNAWLWTNRAMGSRP